MISENITNVYKIGEKLSSKIRPLLLKTKSEKTK